MPRKMALVNYRKCRPEVCDSGLCAAALVCPHRLLRQEAPYEAPMPDPSVCHGCARCVIVCPMKAVQIRLL